MIHQLKIQHFRNIDDAELDLSPSFNLFYGQNGSGKTSLLEAVYYLGFGRSFRSHLNSRIIQYGQNRFSVFAKVDDSYLGLERTFEQVRMRLNGEDLKNMTPVFKMLPLQTVHAHTFLLLEGGPEYRRQFMDWGVFHVEPGFMSVWQRYTKALKQRNQALRQQLSVAQVAIWDKELIETAEKICAYRENYLKQWVPVFESVLASFLPLPDLTLQHYAGWKKDQNYQDIVKEYLISDRERGYTQRGPHRADLRWSIDGIPTKDRLSRGQQKLFVSALVLSQGLMLKTLSEEPVTPIYLLDDLPAELDMEKRALFCDFLQQLDAQVLLTCIEKTIMTLLPGQSNALFHVEQGRIKMGQTGSSKNSSKHQ